MNTKPLMTLSAITMGAAGIFLLFLPDEILTLFDSPGRITSVLVLQISGALYFGFAMLN